MTITSKGAPPDVALVPLECLETEICTLSSQIAAATCRLLSAIAEYDDRRGWADWQCQSMVQWLAWRCGVAPVTAREQLRVAHAIVGLPELTKAFSAGSLSYSQVRAITRVATPELDRSLVEVARSMTAAQLERVLSAYRGLRATTTETALDRHRRRSCVSFVDDDGMRVTILRLAPEEGAMVDAAVQALAKDATASRVGVRDGTGDEDDGWPARRADALLALVAQGAATREPHKPVADRALAVVHVSVEALASAPSGDRSAETSPGSGGICYVEGGPPLAAETVRRLTCGGHQVTLAEDAGGNVLALSRRRRRVSIALERVLRARDGGCVFPGCEAAEGTEAHHLVHWADGGSTDLANLVTLCRFHHHRLHEDGFKVRANADGWSFIRPDGRVLSSHSALPSGSGVELPAACREVVWDACVSDWDGGRLDAYATDIITQSLMWGQQVEEVKHAKLSSR